MLQHHYYDEQEWDGFTDILMSLWQHT